MKEMWRDLMASGELSWRLTIRDISAQYRQTALGYFWAIFPPIVSSLTFILLRKGSLLSSPTPGIPYPVYVTTAAVFWQLFVDALNAPLKVVTESKAILTKINLPKEALILSGVGRVLFSFGIKLLLIAALFIYYQRGLPWTAVLTPIPLLGLLALGTMIGVLLIPLGLLYKDIQQALLVATSMWMFLSPVAYPAHTQGITGAIMQINPVTPLLTAAKEVVFTGFPSDLNYFWIVFGGTFILLLFGWVLYRVALPIIVERIGT